MLKSLDHVILAVGDLDAATADYTRLLGAPPSWQGIHPDSGPANTLYRLDNTYLELLSPVGDGPLAAFLRQRIEEHGEGMLGLAFGTDDIDACRETLAARGFEPGPVERGAGRERASGAERRWRRAVLPPARTRGLVLFPIRHDSPADALPRVAAAEETAAVYGLDHAVVQTTDAAAARALFGEGLGLRLAVDKEFPDWGVRLMFFRVGGITVEVAAALGPAAALPDAACDRLYGLSWLVRDADAARARLDRSGLDVSEVRRGRRPGTRVFTVRSGTRGVPTLMIEAAGAH
jgi:catechol 2,3-dioxygenase-like lactoylglutathione lyase family enzyme